MSPPSLTFLESTGAFAVQEGVSHTTPTFFVAALLLSALAGVACSSSDGGTGPAAATDPPAETPGEDDGDGGVGADDDAAAPPVPATPTAIVAAARCDKLAACRPAGIKTSFGTLATCYARLTLEEDALASLPDVTAPTAAWAQGCKDALANAQCFDDALPTACRLTGTRAKGAKVQRAAQCKSGLASDCGVCEEAPPVPQVGDACTSYVECMPDLQCKDQHCAALVAEKGACGPDDSCARGLTCQNGTCAKPQTTAGAACLGSGDCDASKGLYCATTGTCEAATFGGEGDSCGGGIHFCLDGDCLRDPYGSKTDKVCFAHLKDGASCSQDISNTNQCQSPATCEGTCTLPTADNLCN
jgi:hypothetical protein